MEDILSLIFVIVVVAFSIISKIIGSKKKSPVSQGKDQKPVQSLGDFLQQLIEPVAEPAAASAPGRKAVVIANKKVSPEKKRSLIEDDDDNSTENKSSRQSVEDAAPLGVLPIKASEIGSGNSRIAQLIMADRKFAIVCHEILGTPKSLQD